MMMKPKQYKLKTLIWELTRKLRIFSFCVLGTLGIIQAAFYLKGGHKAACAVIESQFKNIEGPLSRELMLENQAGARLIFQDLVKQLEGLKQSPRLNLNLNQRHIALPACNPHFFHSSVLLPIKLGGDTLGVIQGKLSYFSVIHLFAMFVALFLATYLGTRILCNFLAQGLEKTLVGPIRKLSEGKSLSQTKAVAKEVLEIERNISELKNNFQNMEKQAFELLKAKELGEQAERLSHDIISPLNALNSIIHELTTLTPPQRDTLELAVKRLREITQGLLPKDQQSGLQIDESKVEFTSLKSFVESILEEKKREYANRPKITLTSTLEDGAERMVSLPIQRELKPCISNLINNAVEAIPDRGHISVSGSLNLYELVISVRDDGKGIPEEVIPLLMKKGQSFEKPNGSGLGLYYAKKVLESRGGTVSLSSRAGEGTTVTLALPLEPNPVRLKKVDSVLIDDDELTRRVWESTAQLDGVSLLTFSSPQDFFKVSKEISKTVPIYIDSDLGGTVRGEFVAKDIAEEGFSRICLTTGFDKSVVTKTPWINKILPKMPAWRL